ncbi:MAG: DUF4386 family protein, partial [Candidatus Bathyarchaeia archaeon]
MTHTADTEALASYRGIFKVAGVSAFVFVVIDAVAAASIFSVMPGRFIPVEEWLAGIQANTAFYQATIGFFIVADLLVAPVLLGLYFSLRSVQKTYAHVALALGAISIPMILIDNVLAYSLIGMLDGLAAATSPAGKTAIIAAADSIFLAATLAFVLFYVLMGAATVIFSLAMLRGLFPRWLSWLG